MDTGKEVAVASTTAQSTLVDKHSDGQDHEHSCIATNGSLSHRCHSVDADASSKVSLPPPAPDGGLTAWLQVLAAHLVLQNTWGYINSYGIFQSTYVTLLDKSPSDIAWVGSLELFLILFVGTFSGRAMDAGYLRHCLVGGLILQLLGVFMTSLCTKYWQLILAQGLCSGLGNGIVFCPTIALVSTYFTKKRALAISLQAGGAATGGMIFPAIAQTLLHRIGFGWTVRVMGFVMMGNAAMVVLLVRERQDLPRKHGMPLIDWAAFTEIPYVLFAIGTFLIFWGAYLPYFYIRPFATDVVHSDPKTSFNLLLVLNGVGLPGRVIPGLIADKYLGPINTFIPTVLLAALLMYIWTDIHSISGLWVFVVIYGYFGAGVQSLFPSSLSSLTADLRKIGVRIGMVFSIVALAALSGPPIAGQLITSHGGGYLHAQVFGGTCLICGGSFLVAARIAKHGFALKRRM